VRDSAGAVSAHAAARQWAGVWRWRGEDPTMKFTIQHDTHGTRKLRNLRGADRVLPVAFCHYLSNR
jgi:predicted metalloendopeptidase